MKKFLFLSMLISALSGFAAAPVPKVAPENAPTAVQIFHLCKAALERMADESEKGYLSQAEIENVLKKEMAVIVQHENKAGFETLVDNGLYLFHDPDKRKSQLLELLGLLFVPTFGSAITFQAVLKRSNVKLNILDKSLLVGVGFLLSIKVLSRLHLRYFPLTMIEKYRIEKKLQKAKTESFAILDPEKFHYWPFSGAGFLARMSLAELSRLFFCDFDNLSENEQSVAMKMLEWLQASYPTKYPDINSLKLKQVSPKEMVAMQAFVADATNSNGMQRRCNVVLAQTMYQLLAASGE